MENLGKIMMIFIMLIFGLIILKKQEKEIICFVQSAVKNKMKM